MKQQELARFETAKAMHTIITSLNDETAYFDHWIYIMPDEPSTEDIVDVAMDDELFNDLCKCFTRCITRYGKSGFFCGGTKAFGVTEGGKH